MQDMSGQIRGTFNIAGSEAKVKHLPCSQEVRLDSRLTDLSNEVLGEEYRHPHHQLPGVEGGGDLVHFQQVQAVLGGNRSISAM